MRQRRKWFLILITIMAFVFTADMMFHQMRPAANLQDKVIVLDPGHGGEDSGITLDSQFAEKEITLQVAGKLADLLIAKGYKVVLTRTGDYLPGKRYFWDSGNDLDKRLETAEKNNAALFISLHLNSAPRGNRAGTVVYYNHASNIPSKILAEDLQKKVRAIPEMVKRTAKARNYYLLNRLAVPAVVVELGYLSSSRDREYLMNANFNENIAEAIAEGVTAFEAGEGWENAEAENYLESYRQTAGLSPEDQAAGYLYFPPRNSVRLFMAAEKTKLESSGSEAEILSALRHLVQGPADRETPSSGLFDGFEPKDVSVVDGTATINFTGSFPKTATVSSETEWLALSSIACTLFEFQQIEGIQILINGAKEKTLAGHMDISEPITRAKLELSKVRGGIIEGRKAKVALVLDDCGQWNTTGVKEIMSLDRPITLAVMPNLDKSRQQAEEAAGRGHEVIVHLPMQTRWGKPHWYGPGTVTSQMADEQIKKVVAQDFASVPYATGFNNHMGDIITSQEELIKPVMEVASEKGFFVLDSRTTDRTKVIEMAEKMGIPHTQRDVFLDEVKSVEHIKGQLRLLAEKALTNGSAIGIGHVGFGGKETALAIKEMIPEMEKQGIELVYLSDLVN